MRFVLYIFLILPYKIYSQVDSREFMQQGYATGSSGDSSFGFAFFIVITWIAGCYFGQKWFGGIGFLIWFFFGPVIVIYIIWG